MIEGCTAIILSGGQSKRMGQDKAGVMFQGKTLLQHAESNLTPLFESVVVSSREKRRDTQLPQILDTSQSRAPMLGIAACFEVSDAEWLFVTGVDMPFLSPSLIQFMAENREGYDAVALEADGVLQPLCGFYHRNALPHMQHNIQASKRSLRHLLLEMNTKVIPEDVASVYDAGLRSVLSLDSPQDLQANEKSMNEKVGL